MNSPDPDAAPEIPDSPDTRSSGFRVIPFLVLGLPIGLFVLGAISLIIYVTKKPDPDFDANEQIRLEAAALNRAPVSESDLERSLSVLAERIGPRHLGEPDALAGAAAWIESTLGGGNIGYPVKTVPFSTSEGIGKNLVATLPGATRRGEVVIVAAHYDSPKQSAGANNNASGISALISLARALAGDPQQRSIRFVAFSNDEATEVSERGSVRFANDAREAEERIVGALYLDTIARGSGDSDDFQITFYGDTNSQYITRSANAAFRNASEQRAEADTTSYNSADLQLGVAKAFWDMGYFAVLATGASDLSGNGDGPDETIEDLDLEAFADSVRGMEAVIREWANPD